MTTISELANRFADGIFPALASLGVWATVILAAAWSAARVLKRAPAAARCCVWQFSMAGVLLLPVFYATLPGKSLGLQLGALTTIGSDGNFFEAASPTTAQSPAASRRFSDENLDMVAHGGVPAVKPANARPVEARESTAASATKGRAESESFGVDDIRGWSVVLVALWAMGVFVHFAWLARGAATARSLLRGAEPVTGPIIRQALEDATARMSADKSIGLFRSASIRVPVAIGILRPRILLPADCIDWPAERVRMVLTHEAAHIARRDLAWQLIARVAAAVYWPHPLAWLAIRRLRIERERACDDLVLLAGVRPVDYATGLVETAAALVGARLRSSTGIAMADRPQLEKRLGWILDRSLVRGPAPLGLRHAILLATACLVLMLAMLRPFSASAVQEANAQQISEAAKPRAAATATDTKPIPKGFRNMVLRTIDSVGEPVPTTRIHVSIWPAGPYATSKRDYTTDAKGEAVVLVPEPPRLFRIWTQQKGYVPLFAQWWPEEQPDGELIPDEFTFTLPKGTKIGGVVTNEAGQPIESVIVEVMLSSEVDERRQRPVPSTWLSEVPGPGKNPCITDAEGRWSLDNVPAGDQIEVRVKLTHPNFISDTNWGGLQTKQSVTMKSLRDKSATIVMKEGISITGTVTDPVGKPVAGAVLVWGDDPYMQEGSQEVLTDAKGVYRLMPLSTAPQNVTVVAKGWMPERRKIEIAPDMGPVDFQLREGKKLRIRFVDPAGLPLPGIGVGIANWRGGKSLYNNRHSNVIDTQIPNRAGDNGLYEWTWAPDDAVTYRTGTQGFADVEASFVADGSEHIQTLYPYLRVGGTVRDSATGQEIDEFAVVPVIYFRPDFLYVNRNDAETGSSGRFEIEFDRTDIEHGIQIEKEGYRVQQLGPWKIGSTVEPLDVQLQPAAPLSGRVVDGNGRPVSGADVYLGTHTQDLELINHDVRDSDSDNLVQKSDASGRFAFPAQFEPYVVTVIHDAGYARVSQAQDQQPGELQLQPWARVEGRLLQAGQPVGGAQVSLMPLRPRFAPLPRVDETFWQRTDADGRFVFEHVPPGKCQVMARLSVWEDYPITSSQSVPLDIKPGEKLQVDLGGGGAQVTGRVVLTGDIAPGIDLNYALNYLVRKAPGIEPPAEIADKGFDWRGGWSDAWTSTQEGGAYLQTLPHYFVKLNRDGTFLVSGVPAGEYDLAVKIYEPPSGSCLVAPIGAKVVSFEVTGDDVAKGEVKLGDVQVNALAGPRLGELVPDIGFENADGEQQRLSEFRGRHVLVSFWETSCASCVESLPTLKQLDDEHAAHGLTVISVNLNRDKNVARQFATEQDMPAVQGYAGGWPDTQVPLQYGISTVPAYFIIGPDGKLIHRSNRISEAGERIGQLLKQGE